MTGQESAPCGAKGDPVPCSLYPVPCSPPLLGAALAPVLLQYFKIGSRTEDLCGIRGERTEGNTRVSGQGLSVREEGIANRE